MVNPEVATNSEKTESKLDQVLAIIDELKQEEESNGFAVLEEQDPSPLNFEEAKAKIRAILSAEKAE